MGITEELIKKLRDANEEPSLPLRNKKGHLIIIGCNYHTTWQSNHKMRFVLSEVEGDKVRLTTRVSRKSFWSGIEDLIFIETRHNKEKAEKLRPFSTTN